MPSNPLFQEFRALLQTKFAEDREEMPMSAWMIANTRIRKKKFSFKGYEFQQQIADDMHPMLSCIKCSQVGLTEIQIRKFLGFLKRTTAISGIFTLPDDNMFKRVSQTRVKPLVDEEPVFNMGSERPIRSMGLYQIDQSYGYFVGNKESDATSINADVLFHDELDLSDQEMIGLFQSRLQGSDLRITQKFSTPTFVGFGVDQAFTDSDQHEYLARCESCNHWNLPEFTPKFIRLPGLAIDISDLSELTAEDVAHIDMARAGVHCERCGSRLRLGDPDLRKWVPRHPGRRGRGYRVTPFVTDRLDVPYIIDKLLLMKSLPNGLRRWHNTVLGNAFNDSNSRLSEAEIKSVMKGPNALSSPPTSDVILGIDVGHICHLTLASLGANGPVVFDWKLVPNTQLVETVKGILDAYNVVAGAIDRNPETVLADTIREISDGRIVPVEYATNPSAPPISFVHDELEQFTHVKSNRTAMIDAVVTAIRKLRIVFLGYTQYEQLIIQHLQDMVRLEEPDTPPIWKKLTGKDHFFHSLGYLLHSLRIREGYLFRQDVDNRVMVNLFGVSNDTPQNEVLGLLSRKKAPPELGLAGRY